MSDEDIKPGVGSDDFSGDGDVPLEDFDSPKGGLSNALRSNPLVKIGVVVGGFAAIIVGIALFGGDKNGTPQSMVRAGSDVSDTPGAEQLSKSYQEAVEEKNTQAVEQAIKEGGSSLPVPVTPAVGRVPLNDSLNPAEDPLERWRRIQEDRQRRDMQKQSASGADATQETINNMAQAMSQQMSSILEAKNIKEMKNQNVADIEWLESEREDAKKKLDDANKASQSAEGGDDSEIVDIILPAGTIEYAQLITEANSDAPGPVLAQVVSGSLAGSRILGTFAVEDDEFMTLNFNTIVIDGISHPMTGIAIDPDTANPGMVTDVDHKYFKRVILPAAASFIEGIGQAIADSGSTTVTVDGGAAVSSQNDLNSREELFKGISKAASKVSETLDDEASTTKTLVKVAAGTAMGILFIEPVTEED